ncbi:MAG: hypothetical protein F6K24_00830 [Okeania sp. SIO2D1]|nr:hypothetical protein [Okeania sp. SIO2D1]
MLRFPSQNKLYSAFHLSKPQSRGEWHCPHNEAASSCPDHQIEGHQQRLKLAKSFHYMGIITTDFAYS